MARSNFEFLKGVNDFLFAIARAAEKNYPDDPNTTLVKLRIFGEATAKHLAKLLDIEIPENQNDLLRELARIPFVDDSILQVFHQLRKIGNQAVHEYHNDLQDSEMCLRLAFRLAVWYYRLVTKKYDFAVPVFILPTSENSEYYAQEILSLKQELAQARNNQTQTQVEYEAQQAKLVALNGYISVLESKQEETQEQTQARIFALEAKLKEKDKELAEKTAVERKAYKKQITQEAASRALNIDEEETRFLIDAQLRKAGWDVDSNNLNFKSHGTCPQVGRNMAIAEWPTGKDETGKTGWADYVLFVGLKPIGVIEAKKQNTDVASKLKEAYRYSRYFAYDFLRSELQIQSSNDDEWLHQVAEQLPNYHPTWSDSDKKQRNFQIPFCFSANGRDYRAAIKTKSGIWYRDVRHSTNLAKALPEWHRPEELMAMLETDYQKHNQWFADHPDMSDLGLRYYQEDAVKAVELAIVKGQQDILLAMATGTGKTRTAIALMFRLIQSQRFKRILFLVDRTSLGKQALDAFEDTQIKGDSFNSIFNIKGLTDRFPEDSTKIHVATVQSLVKRTLQSDEVMPVSRYDCIIVDEAHRGYILDKEQTEGELQFRNQLDYISAYRRIIDHFDAVKVALTATPALHTIDIFCDEKKRKPVYRYSYRQAVVDGYLTDQEPPIQIITKLSRDGVYMNGGSVVTRLSPQGELINDTLEDEQGFEVADFNRSLIASDFNRVVCEELVNHIDPTSPQKTLVFCVNNTHADNVVLALQEAFQAKYPDLEHDAIQKITGDSDKDANKVQSMITRFKKERLPNIVVTVDLLTTGIDVPSICNLVFMRKVRSRILYEQMKGRATRLCPEVGKTSFRIFDAVDLYSSLQSVDTMRPVVVRPQVDLQTLVNEITDSETYKVKEADGRSFAEHSHEQLVAKLQRVSTQARFYRGRNKEVDRQIAHLDELCQTHAGCDFLSLPRILKDKGARWTAEVINNITNLVGRIEQLKKDINDLRDMPIFTDIPDEVVTIETLYGVFNKPEDFLEAFDRLVQTTGNQHKALDIVINRPRDLTRKGLVELQEWFDAQKYDDATLRKAWQAVTNQDIAARLVGHIRRAAIGCALLPFEERVDHALEKIKAGHTWSEEQLSWLAYISVAIKEKVVLDDDTFKAGNFKRRGGKNKLMNVFDGELDSILTQFNEYLWDERA
ncbi:type I restriction-modification system endonuclease [Vibrio sp. C8]